MVRKGRGPSGKVKFEEGFDGAAAIVDGTVYVASFDGHIYALDLMTNKEKWKYQGTLLKVQLVSKRNQVGWSPDSYTIDIGRRTENETGYGKESITTRFRRLLRTVLVNVATRHASYSSRRATTGSICAARRAGGARIAD